MFLRKLAVVVKLVPNRDHLMELAALIPAGRHRIPEGLRSALHTDGRSLARKGAT